MLPLHLGRHIEFENKINIKITLCMVAEDVLQSLYIQNIRKRFVELLAESL